MICKNCGKMVLPKNGHIVDGVFYCSECTVQCEYCEDYTLESDAIKLHNGNYVCKFCREDEYYYCDDCGEVFHRDDLTWIEDKQIYVCDSCRDKNYHQCEYCNEWHSFDNVCETYENNWVCDSCRQNHYYTCEDCGYAVFEEEVHYNEASGCDYCPNCYEKHPDLIYSYHDFDNFVKLKTKDDSLEHKEFFGLEIEVSGDESYAKDFLNKVSDVVLMSDSSIGNGFEIVTQPMSRNYISEKFLPNLEKGMKFLNNVGFRGHDRGGIHIHVSQEVFTKQMLCVLRNVLYSEKDEDFEVWKAITQRKTSQIKDWCNFDDANTCTNIIKSNSSYPQVSNERYTALNYDYRTGTYEFRIFNSNTRIERIKKNIQTVYSLIDYAKAKEPHYWAANTNDYIEFVKKNGIFYQELYAFLNEMGIVQRLEEERIAA